MVRRGDKYYIVKLIKGKDYEKDKEKHKAFKEGMLMKWYHLLILIVASVLSFLFGTRVHSHTEHTIVQYDTLKVTEPVYITKYVKDSIKVVIKDTIRVHDTAYMYLPREYRVYKDSMYRAVVSGYEPRLDTIEIYNKTVTHIKEKPKLSFGLQAGYGLTYNNGLALSPYVGLGITYKF